MERTEQRLDARAWLLWVTVTAVLVTLMRHPVYTLILLLVIRLVDYRWQLPHLEFRLPMWRLGAVMVGFSTLFNALFVHVGSTVITRLPSGWPLVGGAITLEAALVGALNGVVLLTLLALFLTFNHIVSLPQLMRLTPGALGEAGLVVLIALTYIPETTRHLRRVQAAQAIRGHQVRGWRDWRPIAIPLLVGGLERSLNLAEAMVARGFGSTRDRQQPLIVRLGLAAGLVFALAGATLAYWQPLAGWPLLALGSVALLAGIWWSGRRVRRTRYRQTRWGRSETVIALASLSALGIVFWRVAGEVSLVFTPYPVLAAPEVDLPVAFSLFILGLPAVWPWSPAARGSPTP